MKVVVGIGFKMDLMIARKKNVTVKRRKYGCRTSTFSK